MCSGCNRVWSIFHVTWSVLYVTSGAAQLVAGIFFLLAIPSLILGCNLITGLWNICMGIGVGMVACCGQVSPRRQEYLLYMTISILIANVVNAIVSEWGFYTEDLPKLLARHQYHLLVHYASLATRIASAAVIGVSFVDSQLTFCSMQTTRPPTNSTSTKKKLRGSHEQVSDIEYIIPRPKSSSGPSKQAFSAYNTQSWVFESDSVNAATHAANHHATGNAATAGVQLPPGCGRAARLAAAHDSPYLKLPQDARPKQRQAAPAKKKGDLENGLVIVADTTCLIDTTPMVHVDEASDDSASNSASNSDRKLCYMKSFSRSTSPAVLSASSSQVSLTHHQQPQVAPTSTPIYECLEKLTQPETFRSRLGSARSQREEYQSHYQTPQVMVRLSQPVPNRSESTSPQIEQIQYASLMKELQKAIGTKIEEVKSSSASKSSSRQDSSHSDGKNSDAEFSKELEAALQLIQDLESPNTIDTPSEHGVEGGDGRHSRSDSEKTLSAVGSLAELGSPLLLASAAGVGDGVHELYTFKPAHANGKSARIVVQYSDSQSTSGYSSPTHNKSTTPKCWSTTSSLNGSHSDLGKPLSYTIHNTKSTAVISLFTTTTATGDDPVAVAARRGKSVTLVNISGDNQPILEPLHHQATTIPTMPTVMNIPEHKLNPGKSYMIEGSLPQNLFSENPSNFRKDLLPNHHEQYTVQLSEKLPDPCPENFPNNLPVNFSEDLPQGHPEHHPEDLSVNLPEIVTDITNHNNHTTNNNIAQSRTTSLGSSWNVKSLLRRKKQIVPKLCPELEGAIVKSESLAYLTELELLARHQRNKDIQRQIEQRVQQQLGTPWTEE